MMQVLRSTRHSCRMAAVAQLFRPQRAQGFSAGFVPATQTEKSTKKPQETFQDGSRSVACLVNHIEHASLSSSEILVTRTGNVQIRHVAPGDGMRMWKLAKDCGLDMNSSYLYNLYCADYADTCMIAIDEAGSAVGYLLGHKPPARQDTYFVWQVGALASMRGTGLARRLIEVAVANCRVDYVEASVTPDNIASNKFFQKFAKDRSEGGYTLDDQWMPGSHFMLPEEGQNESESHEREALYRIGPLGVGMQLGMQ